MVDVFTLDCLQVLFLVKLSELENTVFLLLQLFYLSSLLVKVFVHQNCDVFDHLFIHLRGLILIQNINLKEVTVCSVNGVVEHVVAKGCLYVKRIHELYALISLEVAFLVR